MNESSASPHDQPVFGMRLRAARESKRLSLQDIAERLRLNPDLINILETGDYRKAPPAIFMRGYLRAYARLLDFEDSAIDNGLLESGLVVEAGTPSMPKVKNIPQPFSRLPWLHLATGTVLIMMLTAGILSWHTLPFKAVRDKLSSFLPGTETAAAEGASNTDQTPTVALAVDPTPENPAISSTMTPDVPLVLPVIPDTDAVNP